MPRDIILLFFWSLHSCHLPGVFHRRWETGLYYAWISKMYLGFVQRKGHRALFSNTHYQLLHSILFLLRESYSALEYVERECGVRLVARSNRILAFHFFSKILNPLYPSWIRLLKIEVSKVAHLLTSVSSYILFLR